VAYSGNELVAAYLEHTKKEEKDKLHIAGVITALGSISLALVWGAFGWEPKIHDPAGSGLVLRISSELVWELVAVVNTSYFGIQFARDLNRTTDLLRQALRDPNQNQDLVSTDLRGISRANRLSLVAATLCPTLAALSIIGHQIARDHFTSAQSAAAGSWAVWLYVPYVVSFLAAFGLFLRSDKIAASVSPQLVNARYYWTLYMYGDRPAFVGLIFACLFIALGAWSSANADVFISDWKAVITGAITMQIIIADVLVLIAAANLPYWAFGRLSKGTTEI
jgi:hypothetical protein